MTDTAAIDAVFSAPEYIYKYSSASRVAQIIADLTFYFAPVSQLNDLFEFRARSLYTETEESKYRAFAKRLLHDRWYDSFAEALEAAKDPNLLDSVTQSYADYIQNLNQVLFNIMEHSGVTCFSRHRNNQRMWGTYGVNHSGAVIEFSTSAQNSKFASHLMPVLYFREKFPLCPSEFLTESMGMNLKLCSALCCIKHHHWIDEFEWRLLLLTDKPQSKSERIAPFERTAITRIFLGPRITPQDEILIRTNASKHHPPIPVFKRLIDEAEAKEEMVGTEQILSLEQFKYWTERGLGKQ
ncbi:MAG TPA: DUF2971 domain-containing protein [Verrucomicrobiae bacterium]|nr:DUF2971 domain-containing protein [Verrucomicrobiae bacterium]